MDCRRDQIEKFQKFLESKNITVNVCKNKARGNKGVFWRKSDNYRIDVSRDISSNDVLPVLLHEYAHYVHFCNDKSLKSLEFAFGEISSEIKEELINVTVNDVPKEFAKKLYEKKDELSKEIKNYANIIKKTNPKFKLSENNKPLEKGFDIILKYLLKYDRIKVNNKIYSVENIDNLSNLTQEQLAYIKLKSKKRALNRINSKINRLNKYYNNPTELFARFLELYFTDNKKALHLAPSSCLKISNKPFIKEIEKIFSQ